MRIGIVIDPFSERKINDQIVPQNGGIGVYLQELLQAMLTVDEKNEYFLIRSRPMIHPLLEHPRLHYVQFPLSGKIHLFARYSGLWRDWAARYYRLDLVHEVIPCDPALRWVRYPLVTTVHDLIPLHHPEWFTWRTNWAFRLFFPANMRRARQIITVSEFTKQEICALYPNCQAKTTAVPISIQTLDPMPTPTDLHKKFGIIAPYLLCVSSLEPRKNHASLFTAYARLKKDGYPHQLVCVGGWGWKTESIRQALESNPYRQEIILTGLVDRGELSQLYRQASLFIYPSLYEGFGLPPLEALSSGVPVLVSENSSLREVTGEAAAYLPAQPDADSIYQGIRRLLDSPQTAADLANLGRQRSAAFSWLRTARETLDVYESALGADKE